MTTVDLSWLKPARTSTGPRVTMLTGMELVDSLTTSLVPLSLKFACNSWAGPGDPGSSGSPLSLAQISKNPFVARSSCSGKTGQLNRPPCRAVFDWRSDTIDVGPCHVGQFSPVFEVVVAIQNGGRVPRLTLVDNDRGSLGIRTWTHEQGQPQRANENGYYARKIWCGSSTHPSPCWKHRSTRRVGIPTNTWSAFVGDRQQKSDYLPAASLPTTEDQGPWVMQIRCWFLGAHPAGRTHWNSPAFVVAQPNLRHRTVPHRRDRSRPNLFQLLPVVPGALASFTEDLIYDCYHHTRLRHGRLPSTLSRLSRRERQIVACSMGPDPRSDQSVAHSRAFPKKAV